MPITAGAACVASVVIAWPDPLINNLQACLLMALMVAVGTLMVSTVRFPSSKQPKSKFMFVALAVNLALLAWLQTRYFALFFVIYVSVTLLLNIAWQQGWRGVAPPIVYED
jgi:CDP-diacylglycerol--serine O-phosphatidyltransferase